MRSPIAPIEEIGSARELASKIVSAEPSGTSKIARAPTPLCNLYLKWNIDANVSLLSLKFDEIPNKDFDVSFGLVAGAKIFISLIYSIHVRVHANSF